MTQGKTFPCTHGEVIVDLGLDHNIPSTQHLLAVCGYANDDGQLRRRRHTTTALPVASMHVEVLSYIILCGSFEH